MRYSSFVIRQFAFSSRSARLQAFSSLADYLRAVSCATMTYARLDFGIHYNVCFVLDYYSIATNHGFSHLLRSLSQPNFLCQILKVFEFSRSNFVPRLALYFRAFNNFKQGLWHLVA